MKELIETGNESGSSEWTVCHECDLLIRHAQVLPGHQLRCPRCQNVLIHRKKNSVEHALASSLAGLILFVPANFLPALTLKVLGQSHSESLFSAVLALANASQWVLAVTVFLCSCVVPLLKIYLLVRVTVALHFGVKLWGIARSFRYYQLLDSWGMLEVYMLGILIAIVKLSDLADVVLDWGLFCFIGLLLVTVLMSACIDEETFWESIEKRRRG